MAIEAAQLDDLAVQMETFFGEDRFAEAEAASVLIECDPALLKGHPGE